MRGTWDLGSPTRDQTHAPCSGSHQGSPQQRCVLTQGADRHLGRDQHLNVDSVFNFLMKLYTLVSIAAVVFYIPTSRARGFPRSSVGKESALQCRRPGFNPWVRKIPWRRKWQPTPVFLPGESHGQRGLVGYSPWGCKESDTTERLNHHQQDTRAPISPHSWQHLSLCLFDSCYPTGCEVVSHLILICISLMISDIEQLFISLLLVIGLSFLEKCLAKFFCPFKN